MRFSRGSSLPVGAMKAGAPPSVPIAFVDWNSTTSVNDMGFTGIQVDDVIIGGAYRTADNTVIPFPGGDYKQPTVAGLIAAVNLSIANAYGISAYKVSNEDGTELYEGSLFTGGTSQMACAFRNVDKVNPILAQKFFSGSGNPITLPSLSHNDANAAIFFALRTANSVTVTTGPSGFSMQNAGTRRIGGYKLLVTNYAGENFSADAAPGAWIGSISALKRA